MRGAPGRGDYEPLDNLDRTDARQRDADRLAATRYCPTCQMVGGHKHTCPARDDEPDYLDMTDEQRIAEREAQPHREIAAELVAAEREIERLRRQLARRTTEGVSA